MFSDLRKFGSLVMFAPRYDCWYSIDTTNNHRAVASTVGHATPRCRESVHASRRSLVLQRFKNGILKGSQKTDKKHLERHVGYGSYYNVRFGVINAT